MGQGRVETTPAAQEGGAGGPARESPATCPLAGACDLAAAITRVALLLWRREYCEKQGRFESCERFRMARRGQPVPREMLPNGATAAR